MKNPGYFLKGLINNNENTVKEIYENSFNQVLGFVSNNRGQYVDA